MHSRWIWGAGSLAIVGAVLGLGLQDRLVWDDLILVGGLPPEVTGRSLLEVFTGDFFTRGPDASELHYYRPLVQLSYLLGVVLWNGDPFGYAVSNLVLHLIACGLIFAVLVRFGASPAAAAVGTGLFGLMPRLTESVFWISGRTDVLASVFVLGALLTYDRGPDRTGRRLTAGGLLFLGLLCKEVALAGIVALTLYELVATRSSAAVTTEPSDRRASVRTMATHLAPLLAALVAYLAIRFTVLDGGLRTSLTLGAGARVQLGAETFGRYLLMLADPLHPALRIGSLFAPRDATVMVLGVVGGLGSLAGLVWLSRRPGHAAAAIALGVALAGAALGMVLHLVPMGSDALTADRFLYVPVIGLVMAGTLGATALPASARRVTGGMAIVLVVAFAGACIERASQWSDDARLWHHTLLHSDPHDALPHAWLGLALLDRGEPGAALGHFGQAFRIETAKPRAHRKSTLILEQLANTSVALSALGRDPEALHAIDQALSFRAGHGPYLEQRARVLARMLRFDEALATLDRARRANVDDANAGTLDALARELTTVRDLMRDLPAPGSTEPVAVRVQRARIFGQLGANVAAAAIWREVTRDEAVADDVLLAAAAFFAFRGDPDTAASLIERAAARSPGYREQTEPLAAWVAQRRLDAVPSEILEHSAGLSGRS